MRFSQGLTFAALAVAAAALAPACRLLDDDMQACDDPTTNCDPFAPLPGIAAAGAADGKQNNSETDVDCGGSGAPKCADGKRCKGADDCSSAYCTTQGTCASPRNDDGVKNGSETDIDCGGASGKKCDLGKACTTDADCTSTCNYAKVCVESPSCRPHMGGDTCGAGEVGEGGAKHESCCRSLEVKGLPANLAGPQAAGKRVFLDKYEITAGRMRAFVEAMAAANNNQPDIKTWVSANKPALWADDWTKFLPSGRDSAAFKMEKYTVEKGGIGEIKNMGTDYQFGSEIYAYVHGHNCFHGEGAYGFSTYWYPPEGMSKFGGLPRNLTQDQLDVKSANCVTNAMFAAFCAWDGGMLVTDEVLDFVTGTTAAEAADPQACGSRCAPITSVICTYDSGGGASSPDVRPGCAAYYYPPTGTANDDANRVAAPGRMTTDVVRITPEDEPWMDLHGNLNEVSYDTTNGTMTEPKFLAKYKGLGHQSLRAAVRKRAINNPLFTSYAEAKAALMGARCMRFRQ